MFRDPSQKDIAAPLPTGALYRFLEQAIELYEQVTGEDLGS
jgi:hypothetical protein